MDITLSLGLEPIKYATSPLRLVCSDQNISKYSIFSAISLPVLSVAPVSEIRKLFNLGIPLMRNSIPSSPILFPLISNYNKKLRLLAIIRQEREVRRLLRIYTPFKFLKEEILGIYRITSESFMFMLLSQAVFVVLVSCIRLQEQFCGQGRYYSGLWIQEIDILLESESRDLLDSLITFYTAKDRKVLSQIAGISIFYRNFIAQFIFYSQSQFFYSLSSLFFRFFITFGRDLVGS